LNEIRILTRCHSLVSENQKQKQQP